MNTSQNTPVIIWTLQRTGGTNLARRLFERSGLLEAARKRHPDSEILKPVPDAWKLHEPFNNGVQPRAFGHVTDHWVRTRDKAALDRAMDEICALRIPIKHCVEMLPREVSEALAMAAMRHGYSHLFLYRKKAVNRLLSLQFAKLSGVWGPEMKNKQALAERIFADPLPVQKLVEHEMHGSLQLNRMWRLLKSHGTTPDALAFEEVYDAADAASVERRLLPLIQRLGMSQGGEEDRRFIAEVTGTGEQGTRDGYSSFQGIDQLVAELAKVQTFMPDVDILALSAEEIPSQASGVVFSRIDVAPRQVCGGKEYKLGGVVVLKEKHGDAKLRLRNGGQVVDAQWGIPSPTMAKRFPEAANSGSARFKIERVAMDPARPLEIFLQAANGVETPLFRLHLTA